MYHIKNDKRSKDASNSIYKALAGLMETRPFQKITISAVVEAARVARSTFYRNFDGLDDVLRFRCDELLELLFPLLEENYNKNKSSSNGLDTVFAVPFFEFWDLHSVFVEQLIEAKRVEILNDGLSKMLKKVIGLIDGRDTLLFTESDYFVASRVGMMVGVLVKWVKNEKDLSPVELGELMLRQTLASLNLSLSFAQKE